MLQKRLSVAMDRTTVTTDSVFFFALEQFLYNLYSIDGYVNSYNSYCLKYTQKYSEIIRCNGYEFHSNGNDKVP
jgi:hypothetical protein